MAGTLAVHLNRDGAHAVEGPSAFETDGSFSLALKNHGTPAHVHLRLDDDLSRVLALDAHNHYVEDDATIDVPVVADRPEEVTGTLEVVTGYGAASASIAVTLTPPAGVVVDESLAKPNAGGGNRPERGRGEDLETAAVGALAAVAVLLAGALAVFVEDTVVVLFGAAAVLLALGAAAYLFRSRNGSSAKRFSRR